MYDAGNMTIAGNLAINGQLSVNGLQLSNLTVTAYQTNMSSVYFASDLTVLGNGYFNNIITSNLTTTGNITNNGNEIISGNITALGTALFNNLYATNITAFQTLNVGTSALINGLSILGNRIDYDINVLDMYELGTGDFILGNTNGVAVQSINQTALRLTGDHSQVNIKIEETPYTIQINSDTLLISGASGTNNSVLLNGSLSITNNLYATNLYGSLLNVNTILSSSVANNSILLGGSLSITSNLYATNLYGSLLNVNTILSASAANNSVLLGGSLSITSNLYVTNLYGSLLNINTILSASNNSVLLSGSLSITSNLYVTNLLSSQLSVNTILPASAVNNSVLLSGSLSVTSNLYASSLYISGLPNVTVLGTNSTGNLINTASTSYKGTIAPGVATSGTYNGNPIINNIVDSSYLVIDSINRIVYIWITITANALQTINNIGDVNILTYNCSTPTFSNGQIPYININYPNVPLLFNAEVYDSVGNTKTWGQIGVGQVLFGFNINFIQAVTFGNTNPLQINGYITYPY